MLNSVPQEQKMASHKTDALINGINKYMWKSKEKTAGQIYPSGRRLNLMKVKLSYLCTMLQWLKNQNKRHKNLLPYLFGISEVNCCLVSWVKNISLSSILDSSSSLTFKSLNLYVPVFPVGKRFSHFLTRVLEN